jgi:hypothetical protein
VCALLAVAGGAKALRPGDTARALALFGWPVGSSVVRAGGAAEAVLAAAALVTGAPLLAAAVGVSYLLFAAWVAAAMFRRVPIASCGCFGTPDTPPTRLHVAVDVAAAAVALAAALSDLPPLASTLARQPAAGIPFMALVALVTWMAAMVLTVLPQLSRRAL